jgi:hypothetical protein
LINTRKEITVSGAAIPEFAPYNLGADPSLNTPIKQMTYLADNSHSFSETDGHVYGGRFQWGGEWNKTSNATSYPISVEGNAYTLYSGGPHSAELVAANATYNDGIGENGQIVNYTTGTSATGLHVYSSTGDWRGDNQNDALWGNGKNVGVTYDMADLDYAAGTGVRYKNSGVDKWYQSPQTPTQYADNDPCKTMNGINGKSWRLPTQDEWERLVTYDCNPASAGGGFSTSTSGHAGKAYTWVPVVCSDEKCFPNTTWGSTNSGYAIYKTSDLNGVTLDGTVNLLGLGKDPVLFLPAAGRRIGNGNFLDFVGKNGYYWSSGVDGTYGRSLTFDKTSVDSTGGGAYRALGFSVRCVARF